MLCVRNSWLFAGIKACLFDMDGTLIDSEHVWQEAIQYALALKGIDLSMPEVIEIELGRAWHEIFAEISRRWPEAYADRLAMEAVTVPYYKQVVSSRDISIPGSVNLLKHLAEEGYLIAIASGSTRERIAATISMLGIERQVQCYVGGEDYSKGKPAPDCFLTAAQALGVLPDDCIVFEDAELGVAAALNAGMRCIALDDGSGKKLSAASLVVHDLMGVLA